MNHDFPYDPDRTWNEVETILKMFFQFKMARGIKDDMAALNAYQAEFDAIIGFMRAKKKDR